MTNTIREKTKLNSSKRKDVIFVILLLFLPLLQFGVFYIGVNINSILLSLQIYDYKLGEYVITGFDNFASVIRDFSDLEVVRQSLVNSLILIACTLLIGTTFALVFSYFIYKKVVGYKLFKVILFLPNIVSMIVMVLVYKYFVESALPEFLGLEEGLLANVDARFKTLLFFTIWVGMGIQMLMYSGAMGGIDESIIEAGNLDGVNSIQEFIYIVLPMIFPTVTTFITVGIAGIFTNQMNLYSFYGSKAPDQVSTLGYYFYKKTLNASLGEYPYLAAFGLLMSCISIPLTILVKKSLEKFGPKV